MPKLSRLARLRAGLATLTTVALVIGALGLIGITAGAAFGPLAVRTLLPADELTALCRAAAVCTSAALQTAPQSELYRPSIVVVVPKGQAPTDFATALSARSSGLQRWVLTHALYLRREA